jgi:hypothetical protein
MNYQKNDVIILDHQSIFSYYNYSHDSTLIDKHKVLTKRLKSINNRIKRKRDSIFF